MSDGKVEIDLELKDKGIPEQARKTGEKSGKGFSDAFGKTTEKAPDKAKSALEKLNGTIAVQEQKLSALKSEYKSVLLEQGASTDEAHKLEQAIFELNDELKKNKDTLKDVTKQTEMLGKASDKAEDEIKDIDPAFRKAGDGADTFGSKVKKASLAFLGAFAVDQIVDLGKKFVDAAAEVSAEQSAYEQIMGDYADVASAKLGQVADATGIVDTRLTGNMTSMTAKFKGLGYGVEEATDLAARGLTLSADAAAFWDKSLEESQGHLNSFINGSYEGGEAIGLFANDTQMAAYAVEQGIISETKEWSNLDEATKQATRLEYAENMYAMSGATGQAAREADQYANVMANAAENLRQFMATVGTPIKDELVAPIVEQISVMFGEISELFKAGQFEDIGFNVAGTFAGIIDTLLGLVPQALNAGVQLIGGFALGLISNVPFMMTSVVSAITTAVPMLLQTLVSLASELVNSLPVVVDGIIQAIPEIIQMVADMIPSSLGIMLEGIMGLINAVIAALPAIMSVFAEQIPTIVEMLVSLIVENVPLVIDGFIQLFMAFLQALPTIIETIVQNLPLLVMSIVSALVSNMPTLINGFIMLFAAFVQALPQIISAIIQVLPQMVAAIVSALIQASPQLFQTAKDMFSQFVQGIGNMIGNVRSKASEIAEGAKSAVTDALAGMASIGSNAIEGLINGMSDMVGWAIEKVKGFGSSIISGLKDFLGIHSPSRLFRDEVGKFMAMGVVEGFVDYDPMTEINHRFKAGINAMSYVARNSDNANTRQGGIVQNFNTKVVRSSDDLYTASTIIHRNAARELGVVF